jgi:quinol monooxygenase YgiN
MHVLLVNFNLNEMTSDEYTKNEAPKLAPAFSNLPGLLSKIWLADPATNTFGGVYFWQDRAAMEAFLTSDLAAAVRAHPRLTNLRMRTFKVTEDVTRLTQPVIEIVRETQPV